MSSSFGSGFSGGPNSLLHSFGASREGGSAGALLRLVRYLRPHTVRMLAAFGCMIVTTALSLLVPLLIKIAIDGPIAAGDVLRLMAITVALGAAFAGIYGLSALQRYLLSWVGQRVLGTLRAELFRHLQRLSVSYHDRHIVGVTISHVIGDVAVINEALSQGLVAIAGDTLLLAGIVVAMLTFDLAVGAGHLRRGAVDGAGDLGVLAAGAARVPDHAGTGGRRGGQPGGGDRGDGSDSGVRAAAGRPPPFPGGERGQSRQSHRGRLADLYLHAERGAVGDGGPPPRFCCSAAWRWPAAL